MSRKPDERGSMSVELTLLTIPLVMLMLFVVALGRFSSARNQVNEAARDAAREASLYAGASPEATMQGTAVANQDLSGISCSDRTIDIDTSQLHPGGQVTVTVSCHVPLGDLVLLTVPGTRTVTATSTSVVDTYIQQ